MLIRLVAWAGKYDENMQMLDKVANGALVKINCASPCPSSEL